MHAAMHHLLLDIASYCAVLHFGDIALSYIIIAMH